MKKSSSKAKKAVAGSVKKKPGAHPREAHWAKSAAHFESDASLKDLELSVAISAAERRRQLGPGRTKPISVRMPEEDLIALKEIARINDRPYQQVLVQAVEKFIDDYLVQQAS